MYIVTFSMQISCRIFGIEKHRTLMLIHRYTISKNLTIDPVKTSFRFKEYISSS